MTLRRLLRFTVLLGGLLLLGACLWRRPVQVGFAGELSGKESDLGIGARNGVLLAAEQINAAGGIAGHPLEILVRDDAGVPDMAREVDQELVDAGVVAIIGHVTTAQTLAGLEVTEPAGVVMLSPSASSQALTGIEDLFFRVCADNTLDVIALASHIYTNNGQHTLAIIYDADNQAYAGTYAAGVQTEFERLGGRVTQVATISADGIASAEAVLGPVLADDPDAVLVVASAVNTAVLIQRARLLDSPAAFYGSDWAYSAAFLQAGGRAINGVELAAAFDIHSSRQEMRDFRELYVQRFGYEPNFAAGQAYEAMLVLGHALQETGGAAAGLPEALAEIQNFEGLSSTFSLNEYGDVVRPAFLFRVDDGEFELIGLFQP